MVRWVGWWEEKRRLKLISAKVEVEAELGNKNTLDSTEWEELLTVKTSNKR